VGALRPAKLAAALRAAGHEVTVVTATPAGNAGETDRDIVRVTPHPSPREWLLRIRTLVTRQAPTDAGSTPTASTLSSAPSHTGVLAKLRSLLLSFAWLPDDQQGLILPMVHAVVDAANDRPYDVLVSTAPPFSTHLAALVASTLTGIPWVCEFRDPWIYAGSATSDMHPLASRVNRWFERECLRRSAQVVAVTEQTGALLAARRDALSRPAPVIILNGIDHLASRDTGARSARCGSHATTCTPGEIHPPSTPARFAAMVPPAVGLLVDFVGDCERYDGTSMVAVDELARRRSSDCAGAFASRVPGHGTTPTCSAARTAPADPGPQQLYEYLAAQPILAFIDAGARAPMLRRGRSFRGD
jgi:hypothetical protein